MINRRKTRNRFAVFFILTSNGFDYTQPQRWFPERKKNQVKIIRWIVSVH